MCRNTLTNEMIIYKTNVVILFNCFDDAKVSIFFLFPKIFVLKKIKNG